MNRASPVELRKALQCADVLAKSGIDFVPIPVVSPEQKAELTEMLHKLMDQIEEGAES